jgi:ubiquitin
MDVNWQALSDASKNIANMISGVTMQKYQQAQELEQWKARTDYANLLEQAREKRSLASEKELGDYRANHEALLNNLHNNSEMLDLYTKIHTPGYQPSLEESDKFNTYMDALNTIDQKQALSVDQIARINAGLRPTHPLTAGMLLGASAGNQKAQEALDLATKHVKAQIVLEEAEAGRAKAETEAVNPDLAMYRARHAETVAGARADKAMWAQLNANKAAQNAVQVKIDQNESKRSAAEVARAPEKRATLAGILMERETLIARMRDLQMEEDSLKQGAQGRHPDIPGLFPAEEPLALKGPKEGTPGIPPKPPREPLGPAPALPPGVAPYGPVIQAAPDKSGFVPKQAYQFSPNDNYPNGAVADYIGIGADGKPKFSVWPEQKKELKRPAAFKKEW